MKKSDLLKLLTTECKFQKYSYHPIDSEESAKRILKLIEKYMLPPNKHKHLDLSEACCWEEE